MNTSYLDCVDAATVCRGVTSNPRSAPAFRQRFSRSCSMRATLPSEDEQCDLAEQPSSQRFRPVPQRCSLQPLQRGRRPHRRRRRAGGASCQAGLIDCTNTTVPSGNPETVGGDLLLIRGSDGNTTVKIAMTVSPDTTYHFFLKCVRQLGDIKTGDEGTALATFTFPTDSVGSTYGFDMYPEGAPLGNKFQSATVKF